MRQMREMERNESDEEPYQDPIKMEREQPGYESQRWHVQDEVAEVVMEKQSYFVRLGVSRMSLEHEETCNLPLFLL